jgi:hypothetical protein
VPVEAEPQWEDSTPAKAFVVRHVEPERPRAGASSIAHALSADNQQTLPGSSDLAAPRTLRPMTCAPDDAESCREEEIEHVAVPAACMSGGEGFCYSAAADRLRRQAILQAARSKAMLVNMQQERLAARRAALDVRASIPFVGTYEDNIMCMLLHALNRVCLARLRSCRLPEVSNMELSIFSMVLVCGCSVVGCRPVAEVPLCLRAKRLFSHAIRDTCRYPLP